MNAVLKNYFPGIKLFSALNGADGLKCALKENPDIVLLDILMPKLDGFAVCRRLKAEPGTRDIPVVFLTAAATDKERRIKALEAGGEGFLAKPLDEAELVAKIRAMIKIRAANISLRNSASVSARQQGEIKYHASLDVSPVPMALNDDQLRINFLNKAFSETFGYTRQDIPTLAAWWPKAYPDAEYRNRVCAAWDKEIQRHKLTGSAFSPMEVSVTCKNGTVKTVLASAALPAESFAGQHLVVLYDITERKQAEQTLNASQRLLSETEQIGKVGGWSFNIDTMKQMWTEEVYRIHEVDITPDPSVEQGINYYTPESRPIIAQAVQHAIEHGEGFDLELEIITAKGNLRAVHTIGKADLKNRRIYGFFQDITERKQQELYVDISHDVLKILNEFQSLKDAAKNIVTVLKTRGDFDAVGLRLQEREDFPYFYQDGFPEDFLLTENTLVQRAVDGGLCRDKDGRVCLECTCGLVISGKPSPVLTKGGSFWTNDSFPLLDLPAEQDPRLHPRNNCTHKNYASVALVPIRGKAGIVGLLQLNSHKKNRFTEGTIAQLENMAASIGEALMRNRAEAEREAIHSEFLQSQKMESIGRLAGGVAHDFNNLLTAIGGYAGFLFKGLAEDDPRREDAKEILNATERAGMLTRQLLAFSRKQILAPQLIDLNATLAGTVNMLRRLIGEDVRLEIKLAKEPCVVNVDAGQIGQVLLNLSVNSRDAMPEGGTIVIETSIVTQEKAFFSKHPNLKPGPLVCLSLSDTGLGISPENKEHLFEPFFTTKEKGKGTGLGLSTVFGIIKQSGGDIEVESSTGHGTTFRIYLPQMTDAALHKDKDRDKDNLLRGTETILLVEDEETLRRLGERLLRAGGYTVISATGGLEAIAAAERHGKPVDLLLTDVVMPGMNGRELAKRLADAKLVTRTLYMSGYTDDAVIKHGVLEPGIAFIYKPFTVEELSAKLREVLDGPADKARA